MPISSEVILKDGKQSCHISLLKVVKDLLVGSYLSEVLILNGGSDFYSSILRKQIKISVHIWPKVTSLEQHTYIHYWPLQHFSQDYGLASHTAHVVCVHFIREWRDLQFNVDSKRQIYGKLFHGRFIYSQSSCQKSAERKSEIFLRRLPKRINTHNMGDLRSQSVILTKGL